MKLKYKEIILNILAPEDASSNGKYPIIFLHGFTGSSNDWASIINQLDSDFYPVALDITGHGKSDSPTDLEYYTESSLTNQINFIIESLNLSQVILCGYSMGGRLALSFAINHPEKVLALILESSSPGIEDPELRKERMKNDELLSRIIVEEGVESFIEYWMNIPLFQSMRDNKKLDLQKITEEKKNNNATGLANSLLGFSTGRMKNYWQKLQELKTKTLLITGELDDKFTEINKRMNSLLPDSKHQILRGCGHNTHLENPEEFFIFVSSFLRTFIS